MLKKIALILGCVAFLYVAVGYAAAEVDRDVEKFLNDLEEAVSTWDTYTFIKESEDRKGEKHETKMTRFRFKKPDLMRTDVLSGKKKGSVVLLNKEGKIRGKNRMGFKKTLKPTDKRLMNLRGYTFMNASLLDKAHRLKDHILERGCKATLTAEKYTGKPAYRLHIDHEDADDEVTAEDVWFDKKTYVILKNLKYENEQMVTDGTWREFEINIPLDDGLFEQ